MSHFLAEIELIDSSRVVAPENLVRTDPRVEKFPRRFVVARNRIRLPKDIIADIDANPRIRWIDAIAVRVRRLFRFRRDNRVVRFEVVEHSCFDKIHGGGSRIVIKDRWEDSREITVYDFEGSLAGGGRNSGIDGEFDGSDVFRPIRTVAVDVVAEGLKDSSICTLGLTVGLWMVCRGHEEIRTEKLLHG